MNCHYYGNVDEIMDVGDLKALHASARSNLPRLKLLVKKLKLSETGCQFACRHKNTEKWHETILIEACRKGSLSVVKWIVDEMKPDVLVKSKATDGMMAIHMAAKRRHFEIVKFLLDRYPHLIEAKNNTNWTPLTFAAAAGDFKLARYLVDEKNANVETQDADGDTPFLRAVWSGNCDLVKWFVLEKGASLSVKHKAGGFFPIHVAALSGHFEIFKFLLSLQSSFVEARDDNGNTPLLLAADWCRAERAELAYRRIYDKHGYPPVVNPEMLDLDDNPVFCFDSSVVYSIKRYEGGLKIAKLLVDDEKDGATSLLHAVNFDGNNALHFAADACNIELMQFLLSRAPDLLEMENYMEETPFDAALNSMENDSDIAVKFLKAAVSRGYQPPIKRGKPDTTE